MSKNNFSGISKTLQDELRYLHILQLFVIFGLLKILFGKSSRPESQNYFKLKLIVNIIISYHYYIMSMIIKLIKSM